MRVFKNALLWTFKSKTMNFTVVKKNLLLFVGWNSDRFSRRGLVWSRPYSSLIQSLVCNFVKVPVWSRGNNATLPSLGHLSGLTDCVWQFSVIKKKGWSKGWAALERIQIFLIFREEKNCRILNSQFQNFGGGRTRSVAFNQNLLIWADMSISKQTLWRS